jgi:hypothetical protein
MFYKIKKRLFSYYCSKKHLQPPDESEKELITELKNNVASLPMPEDNRECLSENLWIKHCIELKNNLLKKDPREFFKWKVIRDTMISNTDKKEYIYLRSNPYWNLYKQAIKREAPVFYSEPYFMDRSTNGNSVHHAYHIAKLMDNTGVDISKLPVVFEFGGGYGNMCRLFFNMGFKGKYVIFDLPIFSELQRYYLSSLKLPVSKGNNVSMEKDGQISLISDMENILDAFCDRGLFIGTWSVSEAPLYLREKILNRIDKPDYFLLAYQHKFEEIDNVEFFRSFMGQRMNYKWDDFEIEHLKGNNYLIGKKL